MFILLIWEGGSRAEMGSMMPTVGGQYVCPPRISYRHLTANEYVDITGCLNLPPDTTKSSSAI
jgi:hypothetical protein